MTSKLAIITGGIGGIASAVGKRLTTGSKSPIKLALLYAPFEQDRVSSAVSDAYGSQALGQSVFTYPCDITSSSSVSSAFSSIEKDLLPATFPAYLINSAGYVSLSPAEETTPEEIQKHLNINLLGPHLAAQAFAKLYIRARKKGAEKQGGRIVNLASQAAHVALHNHAAYCASKAGVIALTRCLASEWGPKGITANTISPGPVWTEMGKKAWSETRAREDYQAQVPTGVFAEPEEIAEAVAFLCSDLAKNINGTDIRVDGGYTAR